MDPELWKELEAWAHAELRSVNGQIEFVLKQAVQKRKRNNSSAGSPNSATGGADPPPRGAA